MSEHRKPLACLQLLKVFLFIVVSLTAVRSTAQAQAPLINRDRGREMLRNIKDALKEGYYDPKFRGLNVDARFKDAEKEINQATSTWQINTIIAQVLLELNDSHTRFIPPDLAVGVSFGFQMQMIGDSCYVIRLERGSDAEKKGLKVGDLIYSIEGFEPTRATLWKIVYSYFLLLPPPSLRVAVQHPKGHLTEILITAAVSEKKRRTIRLTGHTQHPPKYYALSNDVMLCKLPAFELNDEEVDQMMKHIRAQATTLILDLVAIVAAAWQRKKDY